MNVRFFAGTKAAYLGLEKHNPIALYFCADTRELYWGDLLLTDGARLVLSKSELPSKELAADGVIYYTTDTHDGYLFDRASGAWVLVIKGDTTPDLTGYYTKDEVEALVMEAIAALPSTDAFITSEELAAKGYVTEAYVLSKILEASLGHDCDHGPAVDLSGYATKEELANAIASIEHPTVDLTDFVKRDEISNFITEIPEQYVTEEELEAKGYLTEVPEVNLDGFATEDFVLAKIAEAELNDKDADLSVFYTKTEVDALIPDVSNFATRDELPSVNGLASVEYVDEAIAGIVIPEIPENVSAFVNDVGYLTEHQSLEGYAKLTDIPDTSVLASKDELAEAIASIEHPVVDFAGLATEEFVLEKLAEIDTTVDLSNYYNRAEVDALIPDVSTFISEIPSEYVTEAELEEKGYLTEHQDLSSYAKTEYVSKTTVAQKYEVLPVDGMLVSYRENEVRINTEHVVPIKQTVGATGNPNMYYVTFRAYAPDDATGVIESDGAQTDTEPTALSVDTYGRKYATIWSAIASFNGTSWTKWGDSSTLDKYLGFYYTFKWFNGSQLIGTDKVRVILTNDTCHDDLVPDAVARRIDDKIKAIEIPEYDLSGYALKSDIPSHDGLATKEDIKDLASTTYVDEKVAAIEIPDVSKFITEIPEEYITIEELAAEGFIKEHQDLSEYAKTKTVITQKYEVLPVDGLLISYRGDEVRLNTQRVTPVHQNVGPTGNPNTFNVTFRAYAPDGATKVIKGVIDGNTGAIEKDTEAVALATDAYGRKYATMWAATAMYTGASWLDYGSLSTVEKYLGHRYVFEWYNEDKLIGSDRFNIVLTNDSCHSDAVPAEVVKRINDKIKAIEIPEIPEGLATEEFVNSAIAAINIPEIDLSEYAKLSDIPSHDELATKEALQTVETAVEALALTTAKERYEVIRVPGLEVMRRDDEIRLNTEHVELSSQNVGEGGEANAYYVGIKIYAPATAESVRQNITSAPGIQEDKEILPFTATDIDSYGRKYSTIWVKCAIYQNGAWLNYGMNSTSAKCLGYYYTVEWYDINGNIVENDSIHVVFTNDACHYSNISDAVSRRLATVEESIATITVPEIPKNVSAFINDAGYLTEHQDLSEYAKRDELPSVDGLATEAFVTEAVATKANDVLFTTTKIVNRAIGGFTIGEDINGLTIAELFAKLLELSDERTDPSGPDTPAEPDSPIEAAKKLVMYSVTADNELVANSDTYIATMTVAEAAMAPTKSGFYQIVNDRGEVVESGYQDLTITSEDTYYIIALPKVIDYNTMVEMQAYDADDAKWCSADKLPLISDPAAVSELCDEVGVDISHIDTDVYTVWALEDTCTGSQLRYIIKEA